MKNKVKQNCLNLEMAHHFQSKRSIELFQVQGGKSNTEQRHTQNSWFLGTIFWSSSLQRWTFFSSYEEDGLFHESIYRPGAREGRCLFQGC